jgi:hypothetical protein
LTALKTQLTGLCRAPGLAVGTQEPVPTARARHTVLFVFGFEFFSLVKVHDLEIDLQFLYDF